MESGLLINFLVFTVSLAVLIKGSDWFVDSAEKIGLSLGINSFVIGVTIVAMGTSLPELASSIAAVNSGESEIVIGNVVGSNVTNILLVLGIVALIGNVVPLEYNIMDVDMPLLMGSAIFIYFAVEDHTFSKFEALIFLAALIGFIINSVKADKFEPDEEVNAGIRDYLMLIVGGVLVYMGSVYTVDGLQGISGNLGIGSEVLAFTVLALGTSLPEVVVSVTAARKGKAGMAIGNVLGSNIFNSYAVLGIPALFTALDIPASTNTFAVPFMIAVTLLFALICISGRVNRYEGLVLLLLYVFFIYKMSTNII
ncbi:calcium/sodium antiporter [Membranihabitans maritimus]|uniref:calcium/sodium antiporter n=1 Tax=Membranihabitans maritimus TaxID=2904244 RepID=UPI001F00044F|nr:calcium/sodium antiporter [Membranihabitans maritimus]